MNLLAMLAPQAEDALSLLKLAAGSGAVVSVIGSGWLILKGMRGLNADCAAERKAMQEAHEKAREVSRNDFLQALRDERDDNRTANGQLSAAIDRLRTTIEGK